MPSYVAPQIESKFNTLSPELRKRILSKEIQINTIHDLIAALEVIVAEDEQ